MKKEKVLKTTVNICLGTNEVNKDSSFLKGFTHTG